MTSVWGAWVITAAIIPPHGPLQTYYPTTLFDLPACQRMAAQKNKEFLDRHIVGFVTCVRAVEDDGP